MTKKVVSLVVAVCLVLTLAFAVNTKSEAASKAGAYKATCDFCVYINAFDAGSSNGRYAYPTNVNGFVYPIKINRGSIYTANANGIITVYYNGGYVYVDAPSCVRGGKMIKIA